MAATIAFLGVTMMYSLNEVARELEDLTPPSSARPPTGCRPRRCTATSTSGCSSSTEMGPADLYGRPRPKLRYVANNEGRRTLVV